MTDFLAAFLSWIPVNSVLEKYKNPDGQIGIFAIDREKERKIIE